MGVRLVNVWPEELFSLASFEDFQLCILSPGKMSSSTAEQDQDVQLPINQW